jgi:hypothetical protein
MIRARHLVFFDASSTGEPVSTAPDKRSTSRALASSASGAGTQEPLLKALAPLYSISIIGVVSR